jgi:hypothetical protein
MRPPTTWGEIAATIAWAILLGAVVAIVLDRWWWAA